MSPSRGSNPFLPFTQGSRRLDILNAPPALGYLVHSDMDYLYSYDEFLGRAHLSV